MNVLVSGSSGLIGSGLTAFLGAGGHQVRRLLRTPSQEPDTTSWNPEDGRFEADAFDGTEAVVHLAAEGIADARWTPARKACIRNSRVDGTRQLSQALARLESPPRVLVTASAIGFYGDRGDELLNESAPPGGGFLPDVCQAWEAAAAPARERGVRVAHLRIGVVLSASGGALTQMLPPFRLGVGGVLGSGKQFMSWIALDDLLGVVLCALTHESISGPVNAVAPHPVTNRKFTKTLGRVLRRPTIFPIPAFVVRALFGEMADALLLASTRVEPAALRALKFTFTYPRLEDALRHTLGRSSNRTPEA